LHKICRKHANSDEDEDISQSNPKSKGNLKNSIKNDTKQILSSV